MLPFSSLKRNTVVIYGQIAFDQVFDVDSFGTLTQTRSRLHKPLGPTRLQLADGLRACRAAVLLCFLLWHDQPVFLMTAGALDFALDNSRLEAKSVTTAVFLVSFFFSLSLFLFFSFSLFLFFSFSIHALRGMGSRLLLQNEPRRVCLPQRALRT
jgi:hypothetical protein